MLPIWKYGNSFCMCIYFCSKQNKTFVTNTYLINKYSLHANLYTHSEECGRLEQITQSSNLWILLWGQSALTIKQILLLSVIYCLLLTFYYILHVASSGTHCSQKNFTHCSHLTDTAFFNKYMYSELPLYHGPLYHRIANIAANMMDPISIFLMYSYFIWIP